MILELLKMIPVNLTFTYTLICLTASTTVFKVAAGYAYDKEKNEITIENLRFTKFLQKVVPLFCVFLYALYKAII